MKKLFLILLFLINGIVKADEYPSLHGGTFLRDLVADTSFMEGTGGTHYGNWRRTITTHASQSPTSRLPYYPGGWDKFKIYIPAGLASLYISFSSTPNTTYRIHTKFRGDVGTTIDHSITSSPYGSTPLVSAQTTHNNIMNNTTSYEASSSVNTFFVSSDFKGGWLYFDIVEDSATNTADHGYVAVSQVNIGYTISIGNINLFNNWLRTTPFLSANGDPSAALSSITIKDVTTPDTITSRSIVLDTGNVYYTGPLAGNATPTVTSFTPTRAIKDQSTLFTITGEFLPNTLVLAIDDTPCTQSSYSELSVGFMCTPTKSGAKNYTIKSEATGYVMASGLLSITDTDPSATPITSVSPSFAVTGQNTLFNVNGNNIPSTLAFAISGADACQISGTPTTTLAQFYCIPRVAGSKEYNVTTETDGNALYYGLLTVATPTITSFSPTSAYVDVSKTFTAAGSNLPTTLTLEIDDNATCTRTSASASGATFNCLMTSTGTKTYRLLTETNGVLLSSGSISVTIPSSSSSSPSGTCTQVCPVGFVLGSDCNCALAQSSIGSGVVSSSSVASCSGGILPEFGGTTTCSSISSSGTCTQVCPAGFVLGSDCNCALAQSSIGSGVSSSSSSQTTTINTSLTLQTGWNIISIPTETNETVDVNKLLTGRATIGYKFYTEQNSWEKWLPDSNSTMTLKSGEGLFVGEPPSNEIPSIDFSVKEDGNISKFSNTYTVGKWYLLGFGYDITVEAIKKIYPNSKIFTIENNNYTRQDTNTTVIKKGKGFWFKYYDVNGSI